MEMTPETTATAAPPPARTLPQQATAELISILVAIEAVLIICLIITRIIRIVRWRQGGEW